MDSEADRVELPEVDRARIRLEEGYRHAVREELAQREPPRRTRRIVDFFQSSLGLWLLSVVLLTWAGAAWTSWSAEREEERLRRHTIERLDAEIAGRLSGALVALYEISDHARGDSVLLPNASVATVDSILLSLQRADPGRDVSLYPEYDAFGLLALVAELRRHVPDGERHGFDQVIDDLSGLPIVLHRARIDHANPRAIARLVHDRFWIRRWRLRFFFSRCGPERPFC
jgi:hypothetical protein